MSGRVTQARKQVFNLATHIKNIQLKLEYKTLWEAQTIANTQGTVICTKILKATT